MTVNEITAEIEKRIPRERALDWDNVGLLVGDGTAEARRVYLALDVTDEVVEHAVRQKADLILSHHPLIFSGMKQVTEDTFQGRRIRKLIRHDISCYAMHTNFDVCVMGDLAAEKLGLFDVEVLEVCGAGHRGEETGEAVPYGIGCVGVLPEAVTLRQMAERTAAAFDISHVKVFGDEERPVCRVAVCPGSGKSDIPYALSSGADVYITGDIDHHSGIDAVAQGLSIIDAGHYGVEHIYMEYMKHFLQERLPELEVFTEPKQEPFWICGR